MEAKYITTDLNLKTKTDITKYIKLICIPYGSDSYKNLMIHSIKGEDNFWYIKIGRPENATIKVEFPEYIKFLKKLFSNKKISSKNFKKIEFDMGFESGADNPDKGYNIPSSILAKVAALGGSINITIYPIES
jgi:hypothetical protein